MIGDENRSYFNTPCYMEDCKHTGSIIGMGWGVGVEENGNKGNKDVLKRYY